MGHLDRPATDLPSFDSTHTQTLGAMHVHTIGNVIRRPPSEVQGFFFRPEQVPPGSAIPTLDEGVATRAYQIASLLQVDALTVAWATALVDAGITSVAELGATSLQAFDALFAAAATAGTIDDVPDAAALVDVVHDATTIAACGVLTVWVHADSEGRVGARVRVADVEGTTGAGGFCRLTRIPPSGDYVLRIDLDGFAPLIELDAPVHFDELAFGSISRGLESVATEPLARLDEYDGDELPTTQGALSAVEPFEGELREDDVFAVHAADEDEGTVNLVSIFRQYEAGVVITRWAQVQAADLDEVRTDTFYLRREGTYEMHPRSSREAETWRASRRALRAIEEADWPDDLPDDERYERTLEALNAADRVSRAIEASREEGPDA